MTRSAAIAAALLLACSARADELRLVSPNEIDYRELEIESENSAATDGGRDYSLDLGAGVTRWWHLGAELEWEREAGPGNPTQLDGVQLESLIRLTEPGEGWLDAGFYSEYTRSDLHSRETPDDLLVGAAFLKDIGRTTHTLDLFLDRSFSPDEDVAGIRFSYAWQSRWNLWRQFAPAIEAFGQAGRIDRPGGFEEGQLIVGPVATGTVLLGPIGKLRYEAGYLLGATEASPAGTVRWKLEMEIPL